MKTGITKFVLLFTLSLFIFPVANASDSNSIADTSIINEVNFRNMTLPSKQVLTIEKIYTMGGYRVADVREANGAVVNLMMYNPEGNVVRMLPWWNRNYWLANIETEDMGYPTEEYGNVGNLWLQPFDKGTILFYNYNTWYEPRHEMNVSIFSMQRTLPSSIQLELSIMASSMKLLSRDIALPGCGASTYVTFGKKDGVSYAYTSQAGSVPMLASAATTASIADQLAGKFGYEACLRVSYEPRVFPGLGYAQITEDGIVVAASTNNSDSTSYQFYSYENVPATYYDFYTKVIRSMNKKYSYTVLTGIFQKGNSIGFYASINNSLKYIRLQPKNNSYSIYSASQMNSYTW